jgi:hypothetical protein
MAVAKSPTLANIPIAEESSTDSAVGAPVIGSGVGALVGADVGCWGLSNDVLGRWAIGKAVGRSKVQIPNISSNLQNIARIYF